MKTAKIMTHAPKITSKEYKTKVERKILDKVFSFPPFPKAYGLMLWVGLVMEKGEGGRDIEMSSMEC